MNRTQLKTQIARQTGVAPEKVNAIIEKLLAEIMQAVARGEKVNFLGFGHFQLQKRAKKTGRNVRHNRPVEIPEHYRPVFKPCRSWVNKTKAIGQ